MRKHHITAEIYDLEFTLTFPEIAGGASDVTREEGKETIWPSDRVSVGLPAQGGKVRLRSNIALENSWRNVPGDLVIKYRPSWFDDRSREYSKWQYDEWVYYKDCPYCHRSRYEFKTQGCEYSACLWQRAYPTIQAGRSVSASTQTSLASPKSASPTSSSPPRSMEKGA